MIPAPLDAVIFDMDGLLLDTEMLYRRALVQTCDVLGYEVTDAFYLSLIGLPGEESSRQFMAYFGEDFPFTTCQERARIEFNSLCRDGIPLRPGARELLEFLKANAIPTGLATSTRRGPAIVNLTRADLIGLLDVVVTRSDVTFGKPHPESYLAAASLLKANPKRCLALEDSHQGVRSAAAAGMATIMVPDMLAPTDEMRRLCVAITDSLGDVEAALRRSLVEGRAAA